MEECTFDLNFNYYFIMTLNHITTEVAPTHTHTHTVHRAGPTL